MHRLVPVLALIAAGPAVAQTRGSTGTVAGDRTIEGITRPVTLTASFVGASANPRGGKTDFGARATGTISRSDFGHSMAASAVSDRVDIQIDAAIEAV